MYSASASFTDIRGGSGIGVERMVEGCSCGLRVVVCHVDGVGRRGAAT
jgi:hypothetical protein